jgi:iron(III) transport system ATP-binding protein
LHERGAPVVISVRPEDIELHQQRPDGANVIEAKVDLKVFLGEYLDYQVVIGERRLLARAHPSFKAAVGESVFIRMSPEKCITIQENTNYRKAA